MRTPPAPPTPTGGSVRDLPDHPRDAAAPGVAGGSHVRQALHLLRAVCSRSDHDFWPDDLSYASVRLSGVVGQRQVTDAYLAALARARGERLVTLDRGLAALHPDVADLVATG